MGMRTGLVVHAQHRLALRGAQSHGERQRDVVHAVVAWPVEANGRVLTDLRLDPKLAARLLREAVDPRLAEARTLTKRLTASRVIGA